MVKEQTFHKLFLATPWSVCQLLPYVLELFIVAVDQKLSNVQFSIVQQVCEHLFPAETSISTTAPLEDIFFFFIQYKKHH